MNPYSLGVQQGDGLTNVSLYNKSRPSLCSVFKLRRIVRKKRIRKNIPKIKPKEYDFMD